MTASSSSRSGSARPAAAPAPARPADAPAPARPAVPPEPWSPSPEDWWSEGVVYEIYPRSFADSDGDGIGDLRGITAHLDHLNDGTRDSLGVDAIWLSPFYPSPMADFGYDVADYCDVHPDFGTLEDFDQLVAQAHARRIRVIVDLVPNHTSDEHPWFVESRSSRTNAKRDWYVWADPAPGGGPPNGWRSHFERIGSAWTLDERTGQYYLHSFHRRQPDLAWWNPEVREAFEGILRFWLERGVDGFRIDVADRTVKVRDLTASASPDLPLRRGNADLTPVVDEAATHELLRSWRRILDEYGGRMAVGEIATLDPAFVARFYGAGDELSLAFDFDFLHRPWSAAEFRASVDTIESLLPRDAWPDYTLSNHDVSRHATRFGGAGNGDRRARLAAMLLLTLRGTPFLYYGEEIGMTDVPIPPERVVDVAGRDPERTPMQWASAPAAGFTTGQPWLPAGDPRDGRSVAAQRDDPRSLLSLYRRLIWYRRGSEALRAGAYRPIDVTDTDVFAFLREAPGETRLVLLHFAEGRTTVDVGALAASARLEVSTDPDRAEGKLSLDTIALGPDEGIVLAVEPDGGAGAEHASAVRSPVGRTS